MGERKNLKVPNALKHGVFAQGLILPGENEKEFAELYLSLINEWAPQGTTECDAVLTIAKAMWRKRRLQKFRRAEVRRRMLDPAQPSYNGILALSAFAELLKLKPETAFKVYADALLRQELIDDLKSKFPSTRYQSEVDRARAIAEEIELRAKTESALIPDDAILSRTSLAFSSDAFKEIVTLEERLDALIDRAVRRLMQAKFAKDLARTSMERGSIDSPKQDTRKSRDNEKTPGEVVKFAK